MSLLVGLSGRATSTTNELTLSSAGTKIALRKGKTEQPLFSRGRGMAGLTCVYLTFTVNAIILCVYIHR